MRLKVYEKLLGEDMAPKLYDLTTAGSSYAVALGSGGLTLDFVSYQEALPMLIRKVLESFNGAWFCIEMARLWMEMGVKRAVFKKIRQEFGM